MVFEASSQLRLLSDMTRYCTSDQISEHTEVHHSILRSFMFIAPKLLKRRPNYNSFVLRLVLNIL